MLSKLRIKYIKKSIYSCMTQTTSASTVKMTSENSSVESEEKYPSERLIKIWRNSQLRRRFLLIK
jgi:hypothetical protein